jgi:hypothetical protein
VHYYEVDSGPTVVGKCDSGFILDVPPVLCREADRERKNIAPPVVRRPHGFCGGRHHAQKRRPSDDLRRPLFAARGKLCASVDLRPRRSRLCAARRGPTFIAERNTAPGGRLPPTPMAAAYPMCIPVCTACTRCRRARSRCAGQPPPRSPAPRFRSAMVWAACSPPPARSS